MAAALAPVPAVVKAPPARRIVRRGIPDAILNNKELNDAIAASLPPNYDFEVPKTVWRVQQSNPKTVALQFPEGLLMYATTLSDLLEKFAGVEHCVILGDVAYGACCVDDITASLLGADILIHYGHSCLVPVSNTCIPCMYVFVGIIIDTPHLISTIQHNFSRSTELVLAGTIQFSAAVQQAAAALRGEGWDVAVPQAKPLSGGEVLGCTAPKLESKGMPAVAAAGKQAEVASSLKDRSSSASSTDRLVSKDRADAVTAGPRGNAADGDASVLARASTPEDTCASAAEEPRSSAPEDSCASAQEGSPAQGSGGGGAAGAAESPDGSGVVPEAAPALVFVADGRFHLEAIMIANPLLPAFRYDPFTRKLLREHYDIAGMRHSRRQAVERAREAQSWGVVLGTLGRQGNTRTLSYVQGMLKEQGRDVTVFLVSELSPAKVAQFEGLIDAWVQIACPRLSIDWGDVFPAPVLTSYEVSVCLGYTKAWWADEEEGVSGAYPMDYYASGGGPWNGSYIAAPLHRKGK